MPTTNPAITPALIKSICTIESMRRSALADLAAMPAHKAGSDWQVDRICDLEFANRWLGHQAERLGISDRELLALATTGPDAN